MEHLRSVVSLPALGNETMIVANGTLLKACNGHGLEDTLMAPGDERESRQRLSCSDILTAADDCEHTATPGEEVCNSPLHRLYFEECL